jgi:hypothetical protein
MTSQIDYVTLDGGFTVQQLEALITWMRSPTAVAEA